LSQQTDRPRSAVKVCTVVVKLGRVSPVASQELCDKPTGEASEELNDPAEAVVDMA